jgi:hypothetical protein
MTEEEIDQKALCAEVIKVFSECIQESYSKTISREEMKDYVEYYIDEMLYSNIKYCIDKLLSEDMLYIKETKEKQND